MAVFFCLFCFSTMDLECQGVRVSLSVRNEGIALRYLYRFVFDRKELEMTL